MVMFCPYCGTGLAEPIGPSCGSCNKDIRFMAAALSDGSAVLTDEMERAVNFQKHVFDDEPFKGDEKLEPGDLIEISRTGYQHWAVYVGYGYVVHLVADGAGSFGFLSIISGSTVAGGVRKDKLKDVVKGSQWKINNEKHPNDDNMLIPRPKKEIVKEALSHVGEDVKYKLTARHSEHFATECRYGRAMCLQVEMGPVGSFDSRPSSSEQNSSGDEKLEPGDLIEISRGNYQHWAVYVGYGYVVHLVGLGAGSSGFLSIISGSHVAGGVRKDKLKDVVKGSQWKINNEKHPRYDNTLIPRPKKEIVKEALSRVGEDVNYKLTARHSEHFATECRYGKAVCTQVFGADGEQSCWIL